MQASSSRRVQILCATLLCCLKESLVFVSINERKTEEKQNFKRERRREEARESALRDDHDERERTRVVYTPRRNKRETTHA